MGLHTTEAGSLLLRCLDMPCGDALSLTGAARHGGDLEGHPLCVSEAPLSSFSAHQLLLAAKSTGRPGQIPGSPHQAPLIWLGAHTLQQLKPYVAFGQAEVQREFFLLHTKC